MKRVLAVAGEHPTVGIIAGYVKAHMLRQNCY